MRRINLQVNRDNSEFARTLNDGSQQRGADAFGAVFRHDIELLKPARFSGVFCAENNGYVSHADGLLPFPRKEEKSVRLIKNDLL